MQIRRFKRVLLSECAVIPPLRLKSICVRTRIAKTEYLPPSIFRILFDSRHPPPFAQVHHGGCYREKFFYFFYSRLDSCFDSVFQIILFNYFDSIKVRHLILDFIQILHRLTRCNFRSIFLICSSLCFTLINFDLFQHCRFYSLTLLLVINKHLCLCEFVLCLFWLF